MEVVAGSLGAWELGGGGGGVGSKSVNLQDGGGGERAEDIWRHLNTKGAAAQVAIAAVNKGATGMH